jgi:hypothetical protein
MRQTLLIIMAIAAVAAASPPEANARARVAHCDSYHPCRPVATSQRTYEACYSLAIERGWTDRRFDWRGRSDFIAKCMRGQIPF